MKRGAVIVLLSAGIVAGVWWGLRDRPPTVGPAVVPLGETTRQTLPGADGEPEVWTLTKREAARDEIVAEMLPEAAPRDDPPDERTDSARALDAQALEAWKTGDLREALDLFEAAVAADPDDWVPRADFGRLLVMMNDLPAAGRHLERAAELNPDSPRVWLDLYSHYQRSMQLERAFHAHARAQELAGGQGIVQDATGLWRLEGDSIYP
ncbi:MAG: tetratricopeptide repeat protein [Myxococcota bacterium]